MAKALTINGLRVILLRRNEKYSDIIETALKQNATAVPALANLTYSDTVIHGKANALQTKVIKLALF